MEIDYNASKDELIRQGLYVSDLIDRAKKESMQTNDPLYALSLSIEIDRVSKILTKLRTVYKNKYGTNISK